MRIFVLSGRQPQLVLSAWYEAAERIVVVFPEVSLGPAKDALLRAAVAFADLTLVCDETARERAIRAGADPDRVALSDARVTDRVLAEPRRCHRPAAAAEALASLSLDAAHRLGLLGLVERFTKSRGVNVVNYHRVLPVEECRAYGRPQMAIPAPIFEAQVGAMCAHFGFTSVDRAHEASATGRIVVTFDDGYEDNYRIAFPILKEHQVPASIFVASGLIESNGGAYWDRVAVALEGYWRSGSRAPLPPELPQVTRQLLEARSWTAARAIINRVLSALNAMSPEGRREAVAAAEALPGAKRSSRAMLTWAEVEEMSRQGIRFGSHTRNHVCLDEVPAEVADEELRRGHEDLSAKLPPEVPRPDTVALPRGKLGPFSEEDLRRRGFRSVMTTDGGTNRPSAGDLLVHRRDGRMLTLRGRHHEGKLRWELTGVPDGLRRLLGVQPD